MLEDYTSRISMGDYIVAGSTYSAQEAEYEAEKIPIKSYNSSCDSDGVISVPVTSPFP
jgi:hypothetical protein